MDRGNEREYQKYHSYERSLESQIESKQKQEKQENFYC
jgi:hypothetical protein